MIVYKVDKNYNIFENVKNSTKDFQYLILK